MYHDFEGQVIQFNVYNEFIKKLIWNAGNLLTHCIEAIL